MRFFALRKIATHCKSNLFFWIFEDIQILAEVRKGAVRELFFIQSLMDANLDIFFSKQGDYRTKDAVFEIGGKNKTNRQIQTVEENCYLIKDDILVPAGNEIPLFYFGFTY